MPKEHQLGQASGGARTRSGCITCRIRKKKCDEQRPSCSACVSRELPCYGYNEELPKWFTNKKSWEDARNSEEAKNLRTTAETRYKISRRVRPVSGSAANLISSDPPEHNFHSMQLLYKSPSDDVNLYPLSTLLKSGVNTWQLQPESIWWDSRIRGSVPDLGTASNDEARLLLLFIDVIHPITHTFYYLSSSRDRGWMIDRLASKKSLYCSALSISACFERSLSQPPTINNIGVCSKVKSLQSRAISELRADIDAFASMKDESVESFIWRGIQILDVVLHLETLEIFSMLQGDWEIHHHAARQIMHQIEIGSRRQSHSHESVIGAVLSALPLGDARRRSLEFSITGYVWIDVLATSTFGIKSYRPCLFDPLELLRSQIIRPECIMDCQGFILAIISEIAVLEQWKVENRCQMDPEKFNAHLSEQDKRIEEALLTVSQKLEAIRNGPPSIGAERDIELISAIWADGAQVLRQATIRDSDYREINIIDQKFVNRCLEKLEKLPSRLVMRATWPYTIVGSMAATEDQQVRFRGIFTKTMQEAQAPGVSWKGLMIMEECWRLKLVWPGRLIGWREAMGSLDARVILT